MLPTIIPPDIVSSEARHEVQTRDRQLQSRAVFNGTNTSQKVESRKADKSAIGDGGGQAVPPHCCCDIDCV
eukprot:scaffold30576_cov52-Attheya_sp.AAC.2